MWEKERQGRGWETTLRLSPLPALPDDPRWTQDPQGSSQPFVRPVTGDLKPSSGFQRHQACTCCTDIRIGKIPINIKERREKRERERESKEGSKQASQSLKFG